MPTSLAKLKERARLLESREQWKDALAVYEEIVRTAAPDELEVGLLNRMGDLYLKLGQPEKAVETYERAVDAYVEAGLANNAIALCNKILRVVPGRTAIYLKLGEICARQGFLADAQRNFFLYAERMRKAGRLDEAFQALRRLVELVPEDESVDARRALADQLLAHGHTAEAVEQLQALHRTLRRLGREAEAAEVRERLATLDPEAAQGAEVEDAAVAARGDAPEATAGPALDDAWLDPSLLTLTPATVAAEAPPPPVTEPTPEPAPLDIAPVEGLEATHLVEPSARAGAPEGTLPSEADSPGSSGDLPLLDLDAVTLTPPPDPEATWRQRLEADPADVDAALAWAEHRAAQGAREDARNLLVRAAEASARAGRLRPAVDALARAHAFAPLDIATLQRRVEVAFRLGDTGPLVAAYVDLARALEAVDPLKATAVWRRVLDLDPNHPEAQQALRTEAEREYVHLGSLILDELGTTTTTRFVVPEEEPSGDEDKDFAEMLAVFRQKVQQNIDVSDSASHYDLGLAFKEMGLLDEAIAEFQVALRGGAPPVATLEMLGECFFEKGQYRLAARVLDRALRLGASEAELLGVTYLLGRCEEALGRPDRAADCYERIVALDITFRDAAQRLATLRSQIAPR